MKHLRILMVFQLILTQSLNILTAFTNKKLNVTGEMKMYLASILNNLNDPRFESHKKLPLLIQLYERLDNKREKDEKNKFNKWRYG